MESEKPLRIVVAHYNEDLLWLEDSMDICTIYSKGGKANAPPYPHTRLPNIGREGQTYLHHIISNYDTLADITIFFQGRIDDHITISLQQIIDRSLITANGQVTTFPFRELETFDHWDGIPWSEYPCWKQWWSMPGACAQRTPREYWQQMFPGTPIPSSVGFHPGALFAVRKETIQRHPKSFYQSLHDELFMGEMYHVNPETGHHLERFWLAMWNPTEYACWSASDVAKQARNPQGQLARGRWHVTPRSVDLDERTIPTAALQ